jgi:serine/threonine protein kinase
MREVGGLFTCRYPCILRLIGFSLSPFEIAVEYAAQGSLRNLLNGRARDSSSTNDTNLSIIICGIVKGMEFIHSRGILHRNLCPEHIFLDAKGHPKIGGFQCVRECFTDELLTINVGSPRYRAPEMCQDEIEYTTTVDVYSFGLILYELVVGPSDRFHQMIQRGKRPKIPGNVPIEVRKIIDRCWDVDPENRGSFEMIWQELEKIQFKVMGNPDERLVQAYITQICT